MGLVYGVGIVMAKLTDNCFDFIVVSFINGIANDLLEPKKYNRS